MGTRKLLRIAILGLLTTITIPAMTFAQDGNGGGGGAAGGGGGGRGGFGGGGGGGNFDPAAMRERMTQRFKEDLATTDDEWKVIQPKLDKVMTLQFESRGGMAFGGRRGGGGGGGGDNADQQRSPVMQASRDLRDTLENKDATPEEISKKLQALRDARTAAKTELESAQKDLKEVLTPRQEAVLVSRGILE